MRFETSSAGSFVGRLDLDRLDLDLPRYAAPNGDLRSVDGYEKRTAKRTARGDGDGVSRMETHLLKVPLESVATADGDDPRCSAEIQLIECHE